MKQVLIIKLSVLEAVSNTEYFIANGRKSTLQSGSLRHKVEKMSGDIHVSNFYIPDQKKEQKSTQTVAEYKSDK